MKNKSNQHRNCHCHICTTVAKIENEKYSNAKPKVYGKNETRKCFKCGTVPSTVITFDSYHRWFGDNEFASCLDCFVKCKGIAVEG